VPGGSVAAMADSFLEAEKVTRDFQQAAVKMAIAAKARS
jgi:hypothetical protein